MRSAVIVVLPDGYLSEPELDLLRHWSRLLHVGEDPEPAPHLLDPVRPWLDAIEPRELAVARLLVDLIAAQCPFERDVAVFGCKLAHISPMCKINPLYEQLMGLRFRCLCFLEGEPPSSAGVGLSQPVP